MGVEDKGQEGVCTCYLNPLIMEGKQKWGDKPVCGAGEIRLSLEYICSISLTVL